MLLQCSYLEAPSGFGPEYKGFADLRLTTWLRRLKNGAVDEARTRDLNLGKVALYQLSYYRIMVPRTGVEPVTRKFSVCCSTN